MNWPSSTWNSLAIALAVLAASSLSHAGPVEVTVRGNEPIYLAGRLDVVIPPLGQPFLLGRHGYVLPDFVRERFPTGLVVRSGALVSVVQRAQGRVDVFNSPSDNFFPPEGDVSVVSQLDALGGLSGYTGPAGALVGVFLSDANPAAFNPPPTLDFSTPANRDFTLLSPGLRQVFFIGNGVTRSGTLQKFRAPQGATRLFLGLTDGLSFMGLPGYYEDNNGAYRITLSVSP